MKARIYFLILLNNGITINLTIFRKTITIKIKPTLKKYKPGINHSVIA